MTTSHTYTPEPGSLAEKVCAYFLKNPDEALSAKDIMLKFDLVAAAASIGKLLEPAIGAKLLRICQANTYAAGTRLAEAAASAKVVAPPVVKAQRGSRKRLPDIDLNAVKIHKGVPMPMRTAGMLGRTKYEGVLGLLTEPGTSFEISAQYIGAINKAATVFAKAHGRKFAVRRINDKTIGVWRVA